MSDEEDTGLGSAGPMMVEVKTRGERPHSHRSRHDESEHYSDDFSEDDHLSDDYEHGHEEEVMTQRSTRRRHSASPAGRKNGQRRIDMTPPDQLLKSAERKAAKYRDNGKSDKSIHELIRCLALSRIVYGSQHWKLAQSHANLAQAYFEQKGYAAQADYHADIGKNIMLNQVTMTTTENEKAEVYSVMFNLYHTQCRALTALKKYPEAEQLLDKCRRTEREFNKFSCVRQRDCDDMKVKTCQASARLSLKQKKYALAGSQYDELIELMESLYGQDSMELIPVYQEAGQVEISKGRHANHQKAIDMFLQAHSIAGANYKEGNPELVDTALAVAQAYANTGDEDAEGSAETYLNECLSGCLSVHGPHHKKTLEVQDELCRLYIRTDRHNEALPLLRQSITDKCEVYGDYSEQVSDTYKLIASVHLSQGNIEKSLRAYNKCYNIECHVLGKNHKKSKDTERTIDLLMASPGLSNKFVLNKGDKLKQRPKFNAIVNRSQAVGGFKSQN